MEENESRRIKSEANEENKRESRGIKEVEKRVEANAQVESNRKWIPWHMLMAFEVLG